MGRFLLLGYADHEGKGPPVMLGDTTDGYEALVAKIKEAALSGEPPVAGLTLLEIWSSNSGIVKSWKDKAAILGRKEPTAAHGEPEGGDAPRPGEGAAPLPPSGDEAADDDDDGDEPATPTGRGRRRVKTPAVTLPPPE